jgi:hypothetical protein
MNLAASMRELSVYLRDALPADNGLTDVGFLHWGPAELEVCLRQALSVVVAAKADSFKRPVAMTTVAGSVQTVPEGCEECLDVLGVQQGDRLNTSMLRRVKEVATLGLPICAGQDAKSEVAITGDDTTLMIDPPLAQGTQVVLMCKYEPSFDNDDELDESKRSAMFLVAVSLAFGQDIESVQSRERSDSFWARAMSVLGMGQRRASTLRSQVTQ